jgi:predicted metalloprotease with PDZ domain
MKKRHLVLLPHDGNTVQYVGNEDKKGLRFVLADKNDTLGVMKAVVRKAGEAYKKGIRTGDYLVSVNGILITDYCSCRNLFTDSNAKRLVFRTPEGTRKEVEW